MPLRDIRSIQNALTSYFGSRTEVQAGYLFGSIVSGRARPDSDVDSAILVADRVMRHDPFQYRLETVTKLMDLLKRTDVDLVLLNEAPPLLAHRVLARGKLIFERSASARVSFQVRTVNRCLDTEPMRRLYLSYLKKHARVGRILAMYEKF